MPLRHRLLAVAVAATWGLNFVVIEVGLEEVPPLLLCALRFALVGVPLAFFFKRPPIPWRLIAGIGVALGVVKFGLLFTSMDVGMPAGLASVVLQAQAPFTLLLAAAVLRETPSRGQLIGLGCALAGIGVIAASREGGVTAAGLSMCVAAAAAWAVANLMMKRSSAADPLALMVWISLIPPLPLLALSLLVDGPHAVGDALAHLDLKSISAIAYIAFLSTLGGFAAWSWLMRAYPAGQVASFALLVPPFGLAFGALLLGEPVGPQQLLAAALVVAGVAQATRSSSARPVGPSTPPSVAPSGSSYSSPLSTSRQRPATEGGSSQPPAPVAPSRIATTTSTASPRTNATASSPAGTGT
ncbi:EamA family transporter [Baekduia sp. Peel2402]|uniref:EamA family transporter n=1 Tax=Baekduia sp. Peel2402 TaxID=3458296 RepID=UPI00403E63D6